MIDADAIRQRWDAIGSKLDERGQRLFAAVEVRTAGWGGLAIVSKITGLARSTINRGKNDLDAEPLPKGQVRRAGGGRRALSENDPGLIAALKRLVEPAAARRGYFKSCLLPRWPSLLPQILSSQLKSSFRS